jgi:fructose-bisphosphate aldolase class II
LNKLEENTVIHLKDVLENAQNNGTAIGHFNISDWIFLKAVFASAQESKVPVIVGASEGERAFLGVPQVAALVKSLRDEEGFPIFLNADHTHSLDSAIEAAKAGFDSVVYAYPHCRLRRTSNKPSKRSRR